MAVKAEDVAARLLAEFPQALRSGQLVTYFQPEVELSSGRVVAAESLARWEHPELGTLSPVLFTSLASKLGLMEELTQLILQLSLRQQRSWAMAGWDIPVSVNVGPECVADPQFPAVIADFLRREQIAGPKLTLEVSEQTRTVAVSSSFFAQLAEFGVRVALDDFGTGFASLESLGDWPVDELKLDMSLVRPMASNASFRAIVRTSIDLAHQLGVKVVAEGVESEAVRSELNALGCDIGQGFLLGKPMSAAVFVDWLRERDRLALRRGVVTHLSGRAARPHPAGRRPRPGPAERGIPPAGVAGTPGGGPGRGAGPGHGRGMLVAVRAVADLPLGRAPASGPDRGPVALLVPNGALVACAWLVSSGTGPGPANLPGLAGAHGGAVPVHAGRRAAAGLRGGAAPAGLSDLGRRRLPELLRGRGRRPDDVPVPPPDPVRAAAAAAGHGHGVRRRRDADLVRGARAGHPGCRSSICPTW